MCASQSCQPVPTTVAMTTKDSHLASLVQSLVESVECVQRCSCSVSGKVSTDGSRMITTTIHMQDTPCDVELFLVALGKQTNAEDNISCNGDVKIESDLEPFDELADLSEPEPLEILDSGEDDDDVIEMPAERRQRRRTADPAMTSFLLKPFFKSSEQGEGCGANRENPILRALFDTSQTLPWVTKEEAAVLKHESRKSAPPNMSHDDAPPPGKESLKRSRKPSKSSKLQFRTQEGKSQCRTKSPENQKGKNRSKSPEASKSPLNSNRSSVLKEIQVHSCSDTTPLSPKSAGLHPQGHLYRLESNESNKTRSSRKNNGSKSRLIANVNGERLVQIKQMVDAAIRDHKVYSMTGGYSSVRRALRERGWIEKIDSDFKGRRRQSKYEEIGIYDAAFHYIEKNPTLVAMKRYNSVYASNDRIQYTGQGEAEIINRMLRNVTEDLCWLSRPYPYYCWKDIGKYDMVNRLPKAYFSNKVGLCNSLQQIQWFHEPGICSTQYPRTYNISLKDEYEAFKDDFRMTSCVAVLKWLTQNYKLGGEAAVRSVEGKVDVSVVEFALRRCAEYVKHREHEDIDLAEPLTIWEHQWDHFLTQYYKLINEGNILADRKDDPGIKAIVTNAQTMLNMLRPYWTQVDIEGVQNYWIVKPGARCCGNGIVIKNNLEQILTIVNPTITRETRYVVQKYIERPYLIYNTKFDIRQWFLVTNVYPLTIWMYRESYLRFCSHPFTLKNTHESVHLSNNAVQRRYKNAKRDRGLPDENMWDCYTFQTHLKASGHPDVWDKIIYPGMKEGFIGALLASQDNMERRRNCFELYGADFMISEVLTDGPWLIEINSNPAMDSSTSITARMCPQVLEDIIKVVIDRRNDRTASTGAFEMIYKQNCPTVPPYLGMSLCIRGKKVYRTASEHKLEGKKSKKLTSRSLESESGDSSEEGNIVEKRCSTDFMQPIKTLIDTIKGGYTEADVKKVEAEDEETTSSESVYYGSDSSEDTDTDNMQMKGKEMELKIKKKPKQKKLRKKTQADETDKTDDSDDEKKKEERRNERGKTDWIRRNIEYVRGCGRRKRGEVKSKSWHESRKQGQENMRPWRSDMKLREDTKNEEQFREEIMEMLRTEACQNFMRELTAVENLTVGTLASPSVASSYWNPEASNEPALSEITAAEDVAQEVPARRDVAVEVPVLRGVASEVQALRDVAREVPVRRDVALEVPVLRGVASEVQATRGVALEVPALRGVASEVQALKDVAPEIRAQRDVAPEISTLRDVAQSLAATVEIATTFDTITIQESVAIALDVVLDESERSANKLTQRTRKSARKSISCRTAKKADKKVGKKKAEKMCTKSNRTPRSETMKAEVKVNTLGAELVCSDAENNSLSMLSVSDYSEALSCSGRDPDELIVYETDEDFSDFDSKFEKKLSELENDLEENGKTKPALNITQHKILRKKLSSKRWNSGKTSMEYFREWKYKVDETRKTCEEMLDKLRVFKEANSKIKFQDVLKARIDSEAEFLNKLKERRSKTSWSTPKTNEARKKEDEIRPEQGDESKRLTDKQKKCAKASWETPKKRKWTNRTEACSLKVFELEGGREGPLNISTESGNVRNVSQWLPKIQQRNRPLLPNGTSGTGKNIEHKKRAGRNKQ